MEIDTPLLLSIANGRWQYKASLDVRSDMVPGHENDHKPWPLNSRIEHFFTTTFFSLIESKRWKELSIIRQFRHKNYRCLFDKVTRKSLPK